MGQKEKKDLEAAAGNPMKEFSSSTKIAPLTINEKDELYDPFDHRDKANANSDLGSLAHMVKSSLGTGILAMPMAIKNGGLIFGGIGTIIIGMICAHCVHILVRTSHILCQKTKTPKMTYAETACAAFECGPARLQWFAATAKVIVNVALCATYIGGGCVYIVFIATSIHTVLKFYDIIVSIRVLAISLTPLLIILGQIRNLKFLIPLSLIANLSITVGFAITLYYIFSDIQPSGDLKLFPSIDSLPKFLATVIFAIEGIGVVMPVENSMRNPHHFLGCPSVLNITMSIVVALYTVMGVFGYLRYGESTMASVTLNLPDSTLGQTVKLLIALAILFTYGLQLFVPLEIMWNYLKPKVSYKFATAGETVMRIVVVLFTVLIAYLIPNLDPFISLVGAVFFSILGISIPAIVETISCWEGHLGRFNWRLWKNGLMLLFSMVALLTGTYVSILEIIKDYTT